MGLEIDRTDFSAEERERFADKLSLDLEALRRLLHRPGFGEGPLSVGAELELFLIDPQLRPLPANVEALEGETDERLTLEIARFNLEANLRPTPLAGHPFAHFRRELESALLAAGRCAQRVGGEAAAIGILPTLRQYDLGAAALTQKPRYLAMAKAIRAARQSPIRIAIAKEDALHLEWDGVTLEGANTSLQWHLRVPPEAFVDHYNAAQLATPVALALCANSPFFLGRRLWDETRVALFRQATDDRGELPADWAPPSRVSFGRGWLRRSAAEPFEESVALHAALLPIVTPEEPLAVAQAGGVPELLELRLHHGTVWSWNRAVFDPSSGGHLRIELRALPSGPTVVDMLAGGALLLGLTLALAKRIDRLLPGLPFAIARENFHRAARDGASATLLWPTERAPSPAPVDAAELCLRLVDDAAGALEAAGVAREDVEPLFEIIRERAQRRFSPSTWQRAMLERLERDLPREDALGALLDRYLRHAKSGRPIHLWPLG